jgi:hypothetical protein
MKRTRFRAGNMLCTDPAHGITGNSPFKDCTGVVITGGHRSDFNSEVCTYFYSAALLIFSLKVFLFFLRETVTA